MEAMERAYRRRLAAVRWVLSGVAFTCLSFSHFTFGPMFPPLIVVAVTCALIVGWGERIVFPLAWRTFDGPRPSPALAEEARKLAREMGVRFGGLRESRARESAAGWSGRTLVVPPWFRELSEGERRYALARQLADAPGPWISALHFIGWPLFFLWFAAWQFKFPGLAWLLGSAVFVPLFLRVVSAPKRYRVAQRRARELTSAATEIAFLTRAREHGSRAAAWDLERLVKAGAIGP